MSAIEATHYMVSCSVCGRVWRVQEGDVFNVEFISGFGSPTRCLSHRIKRAGGKES